MYKLLPLVVVLLFISIPGLSQNLQTGSIYWSLNEEGFNQPTFKNSIRFNEWGLPVERVSYNYSDALQGLSINGRIICEYDDSQRKISHVQEEVVNGNYEVTFATDFIYYEGDCREQTIRTSYSEDHTNQEIAYYHPQTCKVDSIDRYFDNGQVNKRTQVTYYSYENDKIIRDIHSVDDQNQTEGRRLHYESTRNEADETTDWLFLSYDVATQTVSHGNSFHKEFDDKGNLIYSINYDIRADSVLFLRREASTTYFYDDQDKVLEAQTTGTDFGLFFAPTTTTISYKYTNEYYCDGLLKRTNYYPNVDSNIPNAYQTFQYQFENEDCEIAEEEDLVLILPSLTTGLFRIESKLLLTSNSQIAIYDMTGKRIQYFPVTGRTQHYCINITGLPVGQYLVHVFNDKHSEIERVMKI